jgi:hypothetical protein
MASSKIANVPDGYHQPKRTLSSASSKFSYLIMGKNRDSSAKEYRVAVYDSLEGKLWADSEESIKSKLPRHSTSSLQMYHKRHRLVNLESVEENYVKVPIRGTETKVAIYIEVGTKEKPAKIYIATVDLERLGKWAKAQRRKQKMQHLYVLGQIPHGLEPLKEETEDS